MITLSFDLFYAVVGHVQESQFVHGAVDAKYICWQLGHSVAGKYQHLRSETQGLVKVWRQSTGAAGLRLPYANHTNIKYYNCLSTVQVIGSI